MKKKLLPKPRNPMARALREPKFRARAISNKKKTIPRKRKYK